MLQALKMEDNEGRFRDYAPLYGFSTEKISAYIPFVIRKGSHVLCVAGSGDHLLNAVFCGARDVTVFDVNAAASWWTEIKVEAAKRLRFADFERFFFLNNEDDISRNPEALSCGTFKVLADRISLDAKRFFEDCHSKAGDGLRSSSLFNNTYDGNALKVENNLYLRNSDSYALLQHRLTGVRIRYIHSCVTKLPRRLHSSTFDAVLLSNIADYAHEFFSGTSYLQSFVQEVICPMRSRLRDGGVVCAAYLYAHKSGQVEAHSAVDIDDVRRRAFEKFNVPYAELCFQGVIPGEEDMVVMVNA